MTATDAPTRITDVRTVAVPVTDQQRALDFYTARLGFAVTMDAAFGGGRWLEVAPEAATTTLALVLPAEGGPTGVDTGIRLTTGDATADHAALRAAGVDVDPEVLRYPGIPPMFGFRDPDGNRLYVVQAP